jgi:hypothetical protein
VSQDEGGSLAMSEVARVVLPPPVQAQYSFRLSLNNIDLCVNEITYFLPL